MLEIRSQLHPGGAEGSLSFWMLDWLFRVYLIITGAGRNPVVLLEHALSSIVSTAALFGLRSPKVGEKIVTGHKSLLISKLWPCLNFTPAGSANGLCPLRDFQLH